MTVCATNTHTYIDLSKLFYILPLIGTLVTFTPSKMNPRLQKYKTVKKQV